MEMLNRAVDGAALFKDMMRKVEDVRRCHPRKAWLTMLAHGFTVHILIPRCDPDQQGLTDLYRRIVDHEPEHGASRHLMEDDLQYMHHQWRKALRVMSKMGCVEWTQSHDAADLPSRKTRSAPLSST